MKKNPAQDLPDLTEDDVTELTRSFNLFDDRGRGRILPSEMVRFFQKLKLDKDRPSIFACIKSIDTHENNQDGGLTYD